LRGDSGGPDRIGVTSAASIADGGDVVDVDTEAKKTVRHWLPTW
jgi:hypothetical protein